MLTPDQDSSAEPGGAWARQLGDTYSDIARSAKNPLQSELNAAEASKYYGIADRLDRALPAIDEKRGPES